MPVKSFRCLTGWSPDRSHEQRNSAAGGSPRAGKGEACHVCRLEQDGVETEQPGTGNWSMRMAPLGARRAMPEVMGFCLRARETAGR